MLCHGVLFYHNVRQVAIPTENTRSFLNGQKPKASFTIERLRARNLRAQRKELHIGREPLPHACSLKSTLHMSFQLESLNFLLSFQHLFEYHVEQLQQVLGQNPKECHEFNLSFVGP